MINSGNSLDLRAMLENVGEAIRSAGASMSETIRAADVWSEEGLRRAILLALADGPKTGHQIIEKIHADNEWGVRPATSRVYPLLESLRDELLVTVATVKDRRVYDLTTAGKDAAASAPEDASVTGPDGATWNLPNFTSELTTASGRLAKAALDVAQHGTTEQRDAAAKIIDEARRQIHEILAAK